MTLAISRPVRAAARTAIFSAFCLVLIASGAHALVTKAQKDAIKASCRSDYISDCLGITPDTKEALQCLQRNLPKLSGACKTAVNATMAPPPASATAAPPAAAAKPKPAVDATPPKAAPPPSSSAQNDALKAACDNDYLAHCASVAPGGTEAVVCLRQHAMELSVPCKQALSGIVEPHRPSPPKKAVSAPPPPAAAAPPPAAPVPVAARPTAQQLKAVRFTCRRDFRVHCRGVPAGGSEAFACLVRNTARLSPNCRTSVTAIEQSMPAAAALPAAMPAPALPVAKIESMPMRERLAIFRACDRDQAVLCPQVTPGGGRLIICLASHPQALTRRCGRALKRALY